jgi:hypothetical protein
MTRGDGWCDWCKAFKNRQCGTTSTTKPTPSLALTQIKSSLESLKGMPDNDYAVLALFRDIVAYLDRLEKDTPCSDSAASSAASPSDCADCGHTHSEALGSALSSAPSSGESLSPSPTPAGDDRLPEVQFGCGTDGGTASPTPAGEVPHFCLNPSVCRLCHPPAGEGRVPPKIPDWCEYGVTEVHNADGIATIWIHHDWKDGKGWNGKGYRLEKNWCNSDLVPKINSGLAALRADRDRWREKAKADLSKDDPCVPGEPQSVSRDDLEYRWLSQRKTIHGYQKDLARHADRIAELEAAQARQMTTIETLTAQLNEASKACEMWMTLAQPARKYPTVEQVNQWHGQWYRGFSAKVFSDWLRDRAREQEGKGL